MNPLNDDEIVTPAPRKLRSLRTVCEVEGIPTVPDFFPRLGDALDDAYEPTQISSRPDGLPYVRRYAYTLGPFTLLVRVSGFRSVRERLKGMGPGFAVFAACFLTGMLGFFLGRVER
jgi:glycine/D-amino acid oxidase-like deaminating enzyme